MNHAIILDPVVGAYDLDNILDRDVSRIHRGVIDNVPAEINFEEFVDKLSNIKAESKPLMYIANEDQMDYLYHNYGVI